MNQETKKCSRCKLVKTQTDFHANRSECKECNKLYRRKTAKRTGLQKQEYYQKNKTYILDRCKNYANKNKNKVKLTKQKYRQKNKEKISDWHKKHRANNRDEINSRQRNYYQKNKTNILEKNKKWRKRNKDKMRKYSMDWRIKNPERAKELDKKHRKKETTIKKRRARLKARRQKDLNFKILANLRSRLIGALRGNPKTKKTVNILDCTINEFKKYIEKSFSDGMTWQNYGAVWELDHIVPCAAFDFRYQSEIFKCFHYTNFQPLFKENNRLKNDILPDGRRGRDLIRAFLSEESLTQLCYELDNL